MAGLGVCSSRSEWWPEIGSETGGSVPGRSGARALEQLRFRSVVVCRKSKEPGPRWVEVSRVDAS